MDGFSSRIAGIVVLNSSAIVVSVSPLTTMCVTAEDGGTGGFVPLTRANAAVTCASDSARWT